MIYLPTEFTPHYKLTITVLIPTRYDKRGRSTTKTNQIAQSVKFITGVVATSYLWGNDALSLDLIPLRTELEVTKHFTVVNVGIAAPLHFDRIQLAKRLGSELAKKHQTYFSTYVHCARSYSEEELRQDYW